MKIVVLGLVQFVFFFLVFVAGSFMAPFHLQWFISHPTQTSIRFFVPDGLLVMVVVLLVIVLLELMTKTLRSAGVATAVAFLLALVCGFAAQLGFVTRGLF